MEATLTDYLINIRQDFSKINTVKEYLNCNLNTKGNFAVTWKTIEAFNSILAVCSSQDSPQAEALTVLLDSLYYLANYNEEQSVWNHFEFELGVICIKILTAIEQTEAFEKLFLKFLQAIEAVCKHNAGVWKAMGRQILNVFINNKFQLIYLESALKLYVSILKKVDTFVLNTFAMQNLQFLKTMSMLVQHLGDFETQASMFNVIFLQVSDKKLMEDFFNDSVKETVNLFRELSFVNFEEDKRTYLNALNKKKREKKIYSICCNIIYVGGCLLKPPPGRKALWLDANKDSERLSLTYSDLFSSEINERVIYIHFSDIVGVKLDSEVPLKENYGITIKTQNLRKILKEGNNDDIHCSTFEESSTHADILEFIDFLKDTVHKEQKKLNTNKLSQTCDFIFIDRDKEQHYIGSSRRHAKNELQDNAISSSAVIKRNASQTNAFNFFEKLGSESSEEFFKEIQEIKKNSAELFKCSKKVKTIPKKISPPNSSKRTQLTPNTQEMSPRSFVKSLNKHLGFNSPETPHTFEDSIPTEEFSENPKVSIPSRNHKLYRDSEIIFNFSESEESKNSFLKGKKEKSLLILNPTKQNLNSQPKNNKNSVVTTKKTEIFDAQSEECFCFANSNFSKKKPTLPKIRKRKCFMKLKKVSENLKIKKPTVECNAKIRAGPAEAEQSRGEESRNKPSLLDPNGYAYQRWIKPTTSERSNFWLKKLKSKEKEKNTSDSVFDYLEDSEAESEKNAKRDGQCTRRMKTTANKSPLKKFKDILKSNDWKKTEQINKKNEGGKRHLSFPEKKKTKPIPLSKVSLFERRLEKNLTFKKSSEELGRCYKNNFEPIYDEVLQNRNFSKTENNNETDLSETELTKKYLEDHQGRSKDYFDSSEENHNKTEMSTTQKRELSEGDNSIIKSRIKKKLRTVKKLCQKPVPLPLVRCVKKAEERAELQTYEIMETVKKATNHLLSHLKIKENQKMAAYLKVAEAAASILQQSDDSNIRANRMKKVLTYYKTECSVFRMEELLDVQFSNVKSALTVVSFEKMDALRKMEQINQSLRKLIEAEIEKSIEGELKSRRDRLLRCMSEVKEFFL